jgi:hypothetical protein
VLHLINGNLLARSAFSELAGPKSGGRI